MPTEGTPIELKDIKPGDVVHAEWRMHNTHCTATGTVSSVKVEHGKVAFALEDGRPGLLSWEGSTYYLLSRPEKVIDKEDLKLGQRVRIEMEDGNICTGEVVGLFCDRASGGRLVNLDGPRRSGWDGSTCRIEFIAKVVLLS